MTGQRREVKWYAAEIGKGCIAVDLTPQQRDMVRKMIEAIKEE